MTIRVSIQNLFFETTSAHGMIVDCLKNFKEKVKENTKIWKGQLEIIEQRVNSKNIINLINSKNFLKILIFLA